MQRTKTKLSLPEAVEQYLINRTLTKPANTFETNSILFHRLNIFVDWCEGVLSDGDERVFVDDISNADIVTFKQEMKQCQAETQERPYAETLTDVSELVFEIREFLQIARSLGSDDDVRIEIPALISDFVEPIPTEQSESVEDQLAEFGVWCLQRHITAVYNYSQLRQLCNHYIETFTSESIQSVADDAVFRGLVVWCAGQQQLQKCDTTQSTHIPALQEPASSNYNEFTGDA